MLDATRQREVSLTLTALPPSVNHLFLNIPGKGRVRAPHYRKWVQEAGWEIKAQFPGRVHGLCIIDLSVGRVTGRNRDIDNILKPVLDLLVTHRIIEDDSQKYVDEIRIRWRQMPGVSIRVLPIHEEIAA
jgi:crossover junction endodeoxyribonuclease RusA